MMSVRSSTTTGLLSIINLISKCSIARMYSGFRGPQNIASVSVCVCVWHCSVLPILIVRSFCTFVKFDLHVSYLNFPFLAHCKDPEAAFWISML